MCTYPTVQVKGMPALTYSDTYIYYFIYCIFKSIYIPKICIAYICI